MKQDWTRRAFLKTTTITGFVCCGFLFSNPVSALKKLELLWDKDEKIDPENLNYCGYVCPEECKFLKATIENDVELKKEAYELWDLKNRYDVEFDPEKVFCFGCKTKAKPEGIYLQKCSVRQCAKEKNLDACIECSDLPVCEKELWIRFPGFKEKVLDMQKTYKLQQG